MKRTIELKHVGPKGIVRELLTELIDRLEEKFHHFPDEAVSLHALFQENGSHKLYQTSLTCHIPGHTVAAHVENRDAGLSIRKAFDELERQLDTRHAKMSGKHLRKRTGRLAGIGRELAQAEDESL
ncbi:MAG: HPF/RaiA family ribosome-associated protein [Candidatus Omnitrophica bacterium]|nr:HPF/RaiA family ribosome-associated protein [Candidatus Omnitrophota bacterium]